MENGFHATPTAAITKEAGVSAGILFHYYPTKDDLIISLYSEIKKEFYTAAFSNLDEIKTETGRLRLLWSNSWNWGIDNLLKYKFLQQANNSTYSKRLSENIDIEKVYQSALAFFQKGIDTEFLRIIPKEYLILTAFSLVGAMIRYLSEYPEKRSDSLFIEQSWDSFYDCLKR